MYQPQMSDMRIPATSPRDDEPDEAGFQCLETRGDGEIFEGKLVFIQRGNLRRKFKDTRAPRNKLLADKLIGALPAQIGAPGQGGGAGSFFFLKLLLHRREKELLVGITVDRKTEQGHADSRHFICNVSCFGTGRLKLILKQEALDLIVIDSHRNDDGAECAIVSGETLAEFLRGAVEISKGKESVDARTDEKSEKPGERY